MTTALYEGERVAVRQERDGVNGRIAIVRYLDRRGRTIGKARAVLVSQLVPCPE